MSEDTPEYISSNPEADQPPAPVKAPVKGQPSDQPSPSSDSSKTAVPKPPAGKKSFSAFSMLAGLILAVGIGVTGYLVYEQGKAVDVLFDQQNSFSAARDAMASRIESLQGTITMLQEALTAARQESAALVQAQTVELERLENELISTRLRITTSNSGASQEWLLAEAASLLRLAQQQLVMSRNIRTAQALFIAADDVLKQIDDPAIFSVRETLAGELAALRAVQETDVQGLYLQLGGLTEQIMTLRVENDLTAQLAEGESAGIFDNATTDSPGAVSRFFSRIKATLDNYFVVRRRDAPIQALLTPGQEAAMMQTVLLSIEQARTALLKSEQEIYTNSLMQARDTIDLYLSGEAATKASILSSLDGLAGQRVVTEPPPLNRTRQALEQILAVSAQATGTGQ